MTDHDLPPELRHHRSRPPEALPIELPMPLPLPLPIDDELPPPFLNPDRAADKQRNPKPFLRQS
ncbi:MAG TPA: hypothetical protein VHY33_01430 [Thermoanaerobaculia bacterium]|jgi:hypothetical protein|nr:hypothetical protein [Thermoanaerobaculia bacterium]